MKHLKRYKTDAEYNSDKGNLQWPTVCGIDSGEKAKFISTKNLAATVTMYSDKKNYTINDNEIRATIVIAHSLTEPCNIELSCEDNDVTINQDTFTNVIGAVSTYMTYPLTIQDGVNGSKTFEVTVEISSADQTIVENAELVVNNILSRVIPITITSGSDSKSYDGTSLQNNTVTVTSGSLQSGDNISYSGFGQQILVGSSNNIFNYTITPATSASKYNVTQQFGTLTVTDTNVEDGLVITVTAESPSNGYGYGDEVEFQVTVTNIYDTVKSIYLSAVDGMTLAQQNFERVSSDATIETTATYTITDANILSGSFTGAVTAYLGSNNVSPLNYSLSATGSATVLTESPNGQLTVYKTTTSTPENNETYDYNEEITYNIYVENSGNLTISDITVIDELTDNEWTIDYPVAPGQTAPKTNGVLRPFETRYYVDEPDILAGEVLNVATATGTSPDPDEPDVPVTPGEDTELTVDPYGQLTMHIQATSTPQNGNYYQLGETITYNVWVKNDGNLTITNIDVTEELSNLDDNISFAEPGQNYPQVRVNNRDVFTPWQRSYTVTEFDILQGEVVIVATATGTSPDPDEPDVPVASATLTIVTNMA